MSRLLSGRRRNHPAESSSAPGRRLRLSAAGALALLVALPLGAAPATAAPSEADGRSQETAAASCWEIKQNDPSAKSGTYWLWTPQLPQPQQFHCDQETDGGGWVMIGRGRENWKETYAGTGSAQDIADTPDGTGAFSTAQLPSTTVDALLNGQAPTELSDGIRLRRALDTSGSQWQEVRMQRKYSPRWTWTFRSQTPLTSFSFDNPSSGSSCSWWQIFCGSGSSYGSDYSTSRPTADQTTEYFGQPGNRAYNRVLFRESKDQGYVTGFGYDRSVRPGSVSSGVGQNPSSYLWSETNGWAQPFTQMYLRPKVRSSDLAGLQTAENGSYTASDRRELPNSGAEKTSWGATGYANGTRTEMNTQVQAFAEVDGTVFVGGNFAKLNRGSDAGESFDQSYLAGLDRDTTAPRQEFRPRLDGQVKAMAVVDGKLAIGGEFTHVNGEDRPGFAVLDPRTGALDPAWSDVRLENRTKTGVVQVKAMDVREGSLYLAGAFTHTTGPDTPAVWARNAVRIGIADRKPDRNWNPNFNGTVNGIGASTDGERVYAAGYFSRSKDSSAFRLAAVNASDAVQPREWNYKPSYTPAYPDRVMWGFQFDVQDTDEGQVWVGGTEHMLHRYDSRTLQRTGSNITRDGGDFQSLSSSGRTLYGSCHCGDWTYQGAQYYSQNDSAWDVADEISLIGAWDEQTGSYLPEFNPDLKGPGGWGVWSSFTDSRGVLWAGGSLDRSVSVSGSSQWSGGFVRFAPRDVQPPAVPQSVAVTAGERDAVTWAPVAEKNVTYQVLRDGRVIGSTRENRLEVSHRDGARYAVRAMDSAQNHSATLVPVAAGQKPEEEQAPQTPEPTPTPEEQTSASPEEQPSPSASEQASAEPEPSASASPEEQTTAEPTPSATEQPRETALVEESDEWEYRQAETASDPSWNTDDPAQEDGWHRGAAPLGWGSKDLGTTLERAASKPLTTYYRKTVRLEKGHGDLRLRTWADDGLLLTVNGKEVRRENLPDGKITLSSYATAAPRTGAARKSPITVTIPAEDLPEEGEIVLGAEVHANYRSTPDSSFGLTAALLAPAGAAEDQEDAR